jgi:hypothetical protein
MPSYDRLVNRAVTASYRTFRKCLGALEGTRRELLSACSTKVLRTAFEGLASAQSLIDY